MCLRPFQISLDVARALQYLHGLKPPIAHLDVKSQNVLLLSYNHNHNVAKLGDFGTAKVLESLLTSKYFEKFEKDHKLYIAQ